MSKVHLLRGYFADALRISKRPFSISGVRWSDDRIVPKKDASVIDKPTEDTDLSKTDDERNLIVVNVPMKVDVISGVPEEHIKERLVRISKASKSAMQSGTDNTHSWVMQFETRQRWENPLMGWCSSGDPLSNLQLRFRTKEDAVAFCDKNSWQWYVEKEKPIKPKVKSYAFNFSWDKRTRVSTK